MSRLRSFRFHCHSTRAFLISAVFISVCWPCADNSLAQECLEEPVTHVFRKEGESIEISLAGSEAAKDVSRAHNQDAGATGEVHCQVAALELRWSNGRNNGANFDVTFLDGAERPIHTKNVSGFLTGSFEFSFSTSSTEFRPWLGTPWMLAMPSTVVIQAVRPFASPARLSYRVIRVPRVSKTARKEQGAKPGDHESEIVRIHSAVRLIGASKLPLVQIELKTTHPLPIRDVPLQLQIGKRIFSNELTGEHTGRMLTLSLTPEMFAELEDGAEVIAFFDKPDRGDVWNFGRLRKDALNR